LHEGAGYAARARGAVQANVYSKMMGSYIHRMQWRAVLFKQLLVVGIPTKLNHAAMSLVLEEK